MLSSLGHWGSNSRLPRRDFLQGFCNLTRFFHSVLDSPHIREDIPDDAALFAQTAQLLRKKKGETRLPRKPGQSEKFMAVQIRPEKIGFAQSLH